eukprot:CAMPEP_0204901032 /NCGR_PEP_ID=MMETSP1397-20131031/2826_1 /ASSEMBLY_ACC=CAM_ASM_000891 /TAXON_ID=49980 /ORGANISM="Climacostomum Climacostomum virens, Strain Stock W-24" /LENGTH=359 /DNA_ID=CAMNT_0052069303 /DNA_START=1897 /DNA_END=2976 /DNA_ORIENTATION=-
MSDDEQEDQEQDQEEPGRPEYQRSGYSSATSFVPGFGFDGPSESWKRARGLIKPTYEGGSGTSSSEPQEVQAKVETSGVNPEQDAVRRQRFLDMLERKQPEVQAPPQQEKSPQKVLSAAEEEQRRRLAALRERGLEETKNLMGNVQAPVEQAPKPRVLTEEQIRRQKQLTSWIDNAKPEESPVYRVQFEGLKALFRERSNPDIWIELDSGERIGAHKIVLASRSQVFKSMLLSHMQEEASNSIHIGGFSAEAVNSMIEYLYTGALTTDTHHILEMLYLSSAYFLSGLKTALERKLSRMVSTPQVLMLLEAAEATDSWQLYEEIVTHCLANKVEVQRAGVWGQLSPEFKRELTVRTNLTL